METAGYSGPLLWRNKVYLGFSDGNVAAYDARTGDDRWPAVDLAAAAEQTLGELPQYLDVDTTPVAGTVDEQPVVYLGSYVGGVHALDADTGAPVWHNSAVAGVTELLLWRQPARRTSGDPVQELPERRLLIAAAGTSGLWGLSPETGQEVWRRTLPRGGVSRPIPVAGALVMSTSQLGLFLVSPISGQVIDGIHMTDGASMTPIAFGRRLFVMSNGGRFLAVHVAAPEPAG